MNNLFQIFLLLLVMNLHKSDARYAFSNKFPSEDSAVIVDATHIPKLLQKNSAYNIISELKRLKLTVSSTTTTISPDTSINPMDAEFPADLLNIARQKLGLTHLDEIPSVSELGDLLGTSTTDETIRYLRQLTNTDQGIALVKAYIESSDYTDKYGNKEDETDINASTLDEIQEETVTITPRPENSFWSSITDYLNVYNLLPTLRLRAAQAKPAAPVPILVRNSLPYHYPIPIRPIQYQRSDIVPINHATHLNTPKFSLPYAKLAKMVNIPAEKLEIFLRSRPKLAELAAKLDRLGPMAYEKAATFDAQLVAAIAKALEQDEELKKLLAAKDTLK